MSDGPPRPASPRLRPPRPRLRSPTQAVDYRRQLLGEAGFGRAHDFAWEHLIDLHERAYRDAIAAFRGSGGAVSYLPEVEGRARA